MSINLELSKASEHEVAVVYGVYDPRNQTFAVRLNDFFVDRRPVGIKEKSYFFHLLAVMLDAGIPIIKSLQVLAKKTTHERFARIVNTLAYDVEHGRKFSASMTKFPDVFRESEVGVVASGEAIGHLSKLLFRLAEQSENSHKLLLKVRSAMIYPVAVLVTLFVSGLVVLTIVIPRLEDFFVQSGAQMPALTRFVLWSGTALINFSWLFLLLLFLFFTVLGSALANPQGKRRFDAFVLRIPWLNNLVRKLNVSRFINMLSLLVESGIPIHEAIGIASGAVNNSIYKDFFRELKSGVERGEGVSVNMARAPYLFPETIVAMMSVGESTGQMGLIAQKIAMHYEKELENSLLDFTSILEPLVILIVGIAVGIMALALLGPIFSLSTLVS